MVEMNKIFTKSYDKRKPTKEDNIFMYNTCKKTFCNNKCDGYNFFGDKQKQIDFKRKKDGFQKTYSKDRIEMLDT